MRIIHIGQPVSVGKLFNEEIVNILGELKVLQMLTAFYYITVNAHLKMHQPHLN